ncbi:MAG: NAD-dependent epimerase/dehydratase family protein [Myxococcales bacterium]|nr:NAD-dependent epimerase/dehydratase family protein [Myxococcales bacterium]
MRAVITGASGLLGSNLAIALLAEGYDVCCTKRHTSRIDHLADYPLEWTDADLSDLEALTAAFRGADVVFHCAAAVSMMRHVTPTLRTTNVDGTLNVLEAIRRSGTRRLVHASSVGACAVADGDEPVTETDAWNFERHKMDDGYVITKRESQTLVEDAARADIDAVIVNPSLMLGPFDPKPSSGRLIVEVVRGSMPGYTGGWNNFVDVRDVCRGMIAAWHKGRRGEAYILGGENLPYRDAMGRIAEIAGVPRPTFRLPRALARIAGWGGDLKQWVTRREATLNSVVIRYAYCTGYRFSSAKAERELGYHSQPIDEAIRDAVEWFRKRGILAPRP